MSSLSNDSPHLPSTGRVRPRSLTGQRLAAAGAGLLLAGCAATPGPGAPPTDGTAPGKASGGLFGRLFGSAADRQRYLEDRQPWDVTPVRQIGQCGTAGTEPDAGHFDTRADLAAWEAARGIHLLPPESATAAPPPYLVIEQGQKRSGGYGLLVSSRGFIWRNVLYVTVTPVAPPADAVVTQSLTAPCALVGVPAGAYRRIVVLDAAGQLYAESALHTNGRDEGTTTTDGPPALVPTASPAPLPPAAPLGPVEPTPPGEAAGAIAPEAPGAGPAVVPPN